MALWISHPPLEYTHHALPPLLQLWLPHLSLENAHHARPSTSCGYVASHQSQEYAHHTQPVVAMWLSHPSLEYAHHAHLFASASCGYVAISPIPGIRTPCPARCGYVAMWLSHPSLEYAHLFASAYCGYVAVSLIPGVRTPRPARCGYVAIGIDTKIEVIVVSPTTWEAHHSPRAKPEGCGELPRSLVTPQ